MRAYVASTLALALIVPLQVASASPASATKTGIEVDLRGNSISVIGHPSPSGATDAQVTGDIVMSVQGSTFVISVDTESGGGAQLWSSNSACTPSDGRDVVEIRCNITEVIAKFGSASVFVGVDLRGIDERGSGRLFALTGSVPGIFLGSPYADEIYGGDGSNHFEGGAGEDYYVGGTGVDRVIGGPGADTIDVSGDRSKDFVDCNDDSSRGTDNGELNPNEVEWDPGLDVLMDCGAPGAPVGLTRPKIETPFVGAPVGLTVGTWEGKSLKFFYRWYICDPNLAEFWWLCTSTPQKERGAYTPTEADLGKVLVVVVGARNNFGYFEMSSLPSEPVTKPTGPPNVFAPFFLTTAPIVGRPVKFNSGIWQTKPNDTFTYKVEICYTRATGTVVCKEVATGKTQPNTDHTYTPVKNDISTNLVVTVTGARRAKVSSDGYTMVSTSVSGIPTTPVKPMAEVYVPTAWEPKWDPKVDRYSYTSESEIEPWISEVRETKFPISVTVDRVGLKQIASKYPDLKRYVKDVFLTDGAIIGATPDFGRDFKGFPGMPTPPTVKLIVYDKLLDLDACSALVGNPAARRAIVGRTLLTVTTLLDEEKCSNWRVDWSSTESAFSASTVQDVRLVQSVVGGEATTTIVLTATRPALGSLALDLGPASNESVQSYPEHLSLTWDGDLKAVPGRWSSFQVWPRLAATGQTVVGGKYASVELYDVDGRRLTSATWDYSSSTQTLDLKSVSISAVLRGEGVARLVVRIQDSVGEIHEVFGDINVRVPTGNFATLDGRCFSREGLPLATCSVQVPPVAKSAADLLREKLPSIATNDTLGMLRAARAYKDTRSGYVNPVYSVTIANQVFAVDDATRSLRSGVRSGCAWWNVVCHVASWFTPRKARVAVVRSTPPTEPAPPPKALTPTVLEVLPPSMLVGGSERVAGVVSANGCKAVSRSVVLGCQGGINGALAPISSELLFNASGDSLVRATGGGVISNHGGGVISNHGGGIISDRGTGLISDRGLGVISNHGGGLVINGAAIRPASVTVMAPMAGRLVMPGVLLISDMGAAFKPGGSALSGGVHSYGSPGGRAAQHPYAAHQP